MKIELPSKRDLKILITRTDRIGDLVLSTPIFAALRKQYPSAHLCLLTFIEHHELVSGNPDLDDIIYYEKKGTHKGCFGNFCLSQKLREKKFDCVIHLHATNRMHWLTYLAGIPIRIGWDKRLKWALTHPYEYVKKRGEKLEAFYNFDLLKDLDVQVPEELECRIPLKRRCRESLEELLLQVDVPQNQPWVAIHPCASDPAKMWSKEKFAEVMRKMNEKHPVCFLLVGKGNQEVFDFLKEVIPGKVYALNELLSVGMLACLMAKVRFLISNDSGPVHIAQAVGTPVISLFTREDPGINPERWGPLYSNGYLVRPSEATVEKVLALIEENIPVANSAEVR